MLCLLLSVLGVGLASSATAATPSLTVTATFDKASYVPGEKVSVAFSVHNSGKKPAVGISAQDDFSSTELVLDQTGFGALASPTTIAAGATLTETVSGNLQSLTATKVTFAGFLVNAKGSGVADFSVDAPVTARNATLSGEVFDDANANGRAEPGEGASGVKLTLRYTYGDSHFSTTTGTGGQFSLSVPTASYSIDGSGDGWVVIPAPVTVTAGAATLSLRAVKPLGHVLTAKLQFTKDSYQPGDTVHIVATLANTGSVPLFGIDAECDHAGGPDELINSGPGWGALEFGGNPGVRLAAHQTRTFDITDKVPAGAQAQGQVVVECDFGYFEVYQGYRPDAGDTAKVPGLTGSLSGTVDFYPNGHSGTAVGVAGVKVVLADPTTCPVFTSTATSDSKGHFTISGAPAGSSYKLYISPPKGWKVVGGNPTNVLIIGKDTVREFLEVEHGTAKIPAVPTCTPPAPPTGSSSPQPTPAAGPTTLPLANSGADTSAQAALGATMLLGGLVLTLLGRRRVRRPHAAR